MAITIEEQRLSNEFLKCHIRGLPFHAAFHHFTGVDQGPPHDHPCKHTITILKGGYIERVYTESGESKLVQHNEGDTFIIEASHIHKIVELPFGECLTFVVTGQIERDWKFYNF